MTLLISFFAGKYQGDCGECRWAGIRRHRCASRPSRPSASFVIVTDVQGPGDLWYFPAGIPHSLQATDDNPDGSEFLLVRSTIGCPILGSQPSALGFPLVQVFDDGDFSEDDTFLLTDWMSHVPMEVLSKNFGTDISAFAHIPSHELYIFPGCTSSLSHHQLMLC